MQYSPFGSYPTPTAPKPITLTWDTLRSALYCTSPTGLVQLAEHLRRRDVVFTAEELHRELGSALTSGHVIRKQVNLNGGPAVDLYALPGYGI